MWISTGKPHLVRGKKKEFRYFFIFHFSFSQFGINITQLTFDHNLITTPQKRYQLPFIFPALNERLPEIQSKCNTSSKPSGLFRQFIIEKHLSGPVVK